MDLEVLLQGKSPQTQLQKFWDLHGLLLRLQVRNQEKRLPLQLVRLLELHQELVKQQQARVQKIRAIVNMNLNIKLILYYFFIYPLYYIVAMLLATFILSPFMGWDYKAAKVFFTVVGICAVFVCYIVHFNIFSSSVKAWMREKNDKG